LPNAPPCVPCVAPIRPPCGPCGERRGEANKLFLSEGLIGPLIGFDTPRESQSAPTRTTAVAATG
jgi:hypothetical protein